MNQVFQTCLRVLQPAEKLCVVTAMSSVHGLWLIDVSPCGGFRLMLRELGFMMVTEIIWSKDGTGGKWVLTESNVRSSAVTLTPELPV